MRDINHIQSSMKNINCSMYIDLDLMQPQSETQALVLHLGSFMRHFCSWIVYHRHIYTHHRIKHPLCIETPSCCLVLFNYRTTNAASLNGFVHIRNRRALQQNLFKRAFWNPSLSLQRRPTPLPYVLIQTSIFFCILALRQTSPFQIMRAAPAKWL